MKLPTHTFSSMEEIGKFCDAKLKEGGFKKHLSFYIEHRNPPSTAAGFSFQTDMTRSMVPNAFRDVAWRYDWVMDFAGGTYRRTNVVTGKTLWMHDSWWGAIDKEMKQ